MRSPGVWLVMRAYTQGVSVPGMIRWTGTTATPAGRMLVTRRKLRFAIPASISAWSKAVSSVRPSPLPATMDTALGRSHMPPPYSIHAQAVLPGAEQTGRDPPLDVRTRKAGQNQDMRTLVAIVVLLILVAPAAPPFAAGQPAASGSFGFVATGDPDFAAIRRAGGSAVKITADWSAIEAERGVFRWTELDAAIRAAGAAGLTVTVVLAYTPRWASIATAVELRDRAIFSRQPARRIEDWEAFVRNAATRYRSRVKNWQVWTALSLPVWRGTPKDYVRYLTAARKSTKAVDPQSRVVLATPYGLDLVWVHRMVREAGASFDAVSLAPRGVEPEALLRPLRVLHEQILSRSPKRVWLEWDPRSSGERAGWSGEILKVAAIARALDVDRVDWVLDPNLAAP